MMIRKGPEPVVDEPPGWRAQLAEEFEKVLAATTSELGDTELERAKTEYLGRTGSVFPEEPDFDPRMAAFLEWFLLDRPIPGSAHTPLRRFVDRAHSTRTTPSLAILRSLHRSVLSLFRVRKLRDHSVQAVDLVRGGKLELECGEFEFIGFEKGDVFEARLFEHQHRFAFSTHKFLRPKESLPAIKRAARGLRDPAERVALVLRVARLHDQIRRHRNLQAKRVFRVVSLVREDFDPSHLAL